MKYTTAITALGAALAQSSCAAAYFTAISARSASPVHFLNLEARSGFIYLGGAPSSYCPVAQVGDACPPGNITTFAGGQGTLSLGVVVPGGQQVYVASSGALSYTIPHSAYIPDCSIVDGFSITNSTNGQPFGYLNFETGFLACPAAAPETGYQVFGAVADAKFPSECLGISILTCKSISSSPSVDEPGAWQY
ncbi:hypothetical protein ACEQ8H_007713 [Pleosporales sp. CAS-2024a]